MTTPANPTATDAVETAFPLKLHTVLEESEKQGFDDVISWKGNNAFVVHKPETFEDSTMKEYFNQTQYKSFQKQLDLHGFTCLAVGKEFGRSYTHSLLIRGKPNMCQLIKTTKTKKSKHRRRSSAPIFGLIDNMNTVTSSSSSSPPSSLSSLPSQRPTQRPSQRQPQIRHGRSSSDSSSLGLTFEPPVTPMPRRNNAKNRRKMAGSSFPPESIVQSFYGSYSPLSIEEGRELLPHNDVRGKFKFPRIIECTEQSDRQITKKHRSNKSWSPTGKHRKTHGDSSSVATMDWLSSAFEGTLESSPSPLVEEETIFHKIIDVEDDDDTHSIHSFSSLPMGIERASDKVLEDCSESFRDSTMRCLDAGLKVLQTARVSL